MSEGWNIAVLGATGAWAKPCLKRWLNVSSRLGSLCTGTNSAGEQLRFGGKTITVQDAAEFDWTQAQLAFFCRRQRSYRCLG